MTHRLSFTVPGPPRPKARPRLGAHGNVYTPRETASYEASVRVHAMRAMALSGWRIGQPGSFSVWIHVYWPDARRKDADNAAKAMMDGMSGMVFDDDASVCELHVYTAIDREKPRADIEVERLADHKSSCRHAGSDLGK